METMNEYRLAQIVGPIIDAQPGVYDLPAILADLIQAYDLTGDAPTQTVDDIGDGLWDIVLAHTLPEIMTRDEVAAYWPVAPSAVSSTMSRHGVPVDSREAGRTGQSRYRADLVVAAKQAAPGQGRRTDLRGASESA